MNTIYVIAAVIGAVSAGYIVPGEHSAAFAEGYGGPVGYHGGPIGGFPIQKGAEYHTPLVGGYQKGGFGPTLVGGYHSKGVIPLQAPAYGGYQPLFKPDLKIVGKYQAPVFAGYQVPFKHGVKEVTEYQAPVFSGYQAPVFSGYQSPIKAGPFGYSAERFGHKSFYGGYAASVPGFNYWKNKKAA